MAIRGISSNSFLNNSSSINQIKLQQALGKNPSTNASSKDENYNKSAEFADSLSFLKSYNSSMTDLMTSANKLRDVNSASVTKELSVSSSDTDVLNASKSYNLKGSAGNTYEVAVEQLAAAQKNVSADFKSTGKAAADISLDIITGGSNISINVSKSDADGIGKTNKQLLQDAAKEINSKKAGIEASVVEKDGRSSLLLTGAAGKDNAFIVSGDFADKAGLANASQVAQNAQYSVKTNDGSTREYSSASNKISLEYGKISATLNKTGSATVAVGTDSSKIVSAVDDLVNKYNNTLKVLNDNADRGTGATRQLSNMLAGISSEKSLEQVGISTNKDGTLKLDKDKLAASMKKDPDLTKDIISGSYGLAQGAYQKGVSGLQTTSSSLINNDIEQITAERITDPINMMNMYNRNGAYSMINYSTAGMLFNMYV